MANKSLVVRSERGEVFAVARHHLVDVYVGAGKVTVSSIKGSRTLDVSKEEQQRVAEQVSALYGDDDD